MLVEDHRALDIKEEERRARHVLRGIKPNEAETVQAVVSLFEPFMGL